MLESGIRNARQTTASSAKNKARSLRNSDRIKIKYGSYGLDLIENDKNIRVSKLYSTHDGSKINRTFAVVTYPQVIHPAFEKEHQEIIAGQSIGEVFEQNGWAIDKQHLYLGEIDIPPEHADSHSLFDNGAKRPAIHIYSLAVSKGTVHFDYAMIAEIHHPDFLQLEELEKIYGQDHDDYRHDPQEVREFLVIVRSKIQQL